MCVVIAENASVLEACRYYLSEIPFARTGRNNEAIDLRLNVARRQVHQLRVNESYRELMRLNESYRQVSVCNRY